MNDFKQVLSKEEWTGFTLRALYAAAGYEKYRMSKFEEYDLYVRNKDFLVSDSVITFTDTDGKLLALKPDVTLSILKNAKLPQQGTMKVYYNETVYRVSKGTKSYKELLQAGLECLGEVTDEELAQVLTLAAESLEAISANNVLELSHLGIVEGIFRYCGLTPADAAAAWRCLGEKNLVGVQSVAESAGLAEQEAMLLENLVTVYGAAEKVVDLLDVFGVDEDTQKSVADFKRLIQALQTRGAAEKLRVDFSVLGDMKYYSGVAFKGFVEGIPTGVLSGGQYDKLMARMGKKGKAVGFAVYLDEVGKIKE